jgi:hypothetical protein
MVALLEQLLKTAGAHLFRDVINKVSRRDASGYGYDAAYSYRAPGTIVRPKLPT